MVQYCTIGYPGGPEGGLSKPLVSRARQVVSGTPRVGTRKVPAAVTQPEKLPHKVVYERRTLMTAESTISWRRLE